MTFPDSKFDQIAAYSDAYFVHYAKAAASVDREKLAVAVEILQGAYENKKNLYVCGNGGSASISNHLVCDHGKLIATDTDLLPRTESLASNIEVITAIAMTEPGAGSDLQGVRTSAVEDGDGYILNGAKTFITNGQLTDLVVVVAKTDNSLFNGCAKKCGTCAIAVTFSTSSTPSGKVSPHWL